MPTNRTRRARKRVREAIADWKVHYMLRGEEPTGSAATFELITWNSCADWELYRERLMDTWIEEHPGIRPWAWWQYDAPRATVEDLGEKWACLFTQEGDKHVHHVPAAPRLRVGGIGTPAYVALAHGPAFTFGIPKDWITQWEVDYYNGRAKNIHGEPIGAQFSEGHFPYEAYDPTDPPQFESEEAYLRRHDLLTGSETRLLAKQATQEN